MTLTAARLERCGLHPERVQILNDAPVRKDGPVIYWMQASQRENCNHALEYAILQANELQRPLLVWFGLTGSYPGAAWRHYAFLLEGLTDAAQELAKRGIPFVAEQTAPDEGIVRAAAEAALVVVDRGYTRIQRNWRERAAGALSCRLIQVESDVVVPVEWASAKEEYAARTLRSKIQRHLERFLVPLRRQKLKCASPGMQRRSLDLSRPEKILAGLDIDRGVPPSPVFRGGHTEARRRLTSFVRHRLDGYDKNSSDPSLDATSRLSPYLHFGQIAPIEIALAVQRHGGPGADGYLEQLIVRRELAVNFVLHNPHYDSFDCLPDWARATLRKHHRDKREYLYAPETLEAGQTHDPYWNAAQRQMTHSGFMHNYMRMYWGKKVIEWRRSPRDAYTWLVRMNDRYQLDGRDPNGYAGVAWCFGKHDRPWSERSVFGTVRYMNAAGLERKFDMQAYLRMTGTGKD